MDLITLCSCGFLSLLALFLSLPERHRMFSAHCFLQLHLCISLHFTTSLEFSTIEWLFTRAVCELCKFAPSPDGSGVLGSRGSVRRFSLVAVVEGCAAGNRSTWVVSLVLVPTAWMTAGNPLHRFRKLVGGLCFCLEWGPQAVLIRKLKMGNACVLLRLIPEPDLLAVRKHFIY